MTNYIQTNDYIKKESIHNLLKEYIKNIFLKRVSTCGISMTKNYAHKRKTPIFTDYVKEIFINLSLRTGEPPRSYKCLL